jgi:hypothetical protein
MREKEVLTQKKKKKRRISLPQWVAKRLRGSE